jgi:hypothetical protein
MTRKVRLEETRERDFDRAFWQAHTPNERFTATWELITLYLTLKGREDELRLQRSVAVFQRREG